MSSRTAPVAILTLIVMGTLNGFPTPPAMGAGGQSPPVPGAIGTLAAGGAATAQTPAPAPAAPEAEKPAVDVGALLTRAKELHGAKNWTALKSLGKDITTADASNADGNAYLGLAAKNLKKCREATKPLGKAFGKTSLPGVPRALAECLGPSPKDKTLAGRAWLAAAREDKDGEAALKAAKLLAGNAKMVNQQFEAYAYAEDHGKLPDEELKAYAQAAESAKKLAEAKKIYEKALTKKPNDRTLILPLARLQLQTKDAEGAEAAVADILRAYPDDPEALIVKADAAALRGDAATEEQTLRQALAKQTQNEALRKRFASLLGKQARIKIDAGDTSAAKEKADEALKLDARSGAASDALARALWTAGDRDGARKVLKNVADAPDSEVSGEGLRLAAEVAIDAKETGKAKALLDRAARLGSPSLSCTKARLAYSQGKLAEAEGNISAQLNATPDNAEALRLGGDIAYEGGRAKVARERYEGADKAGALPPKSQARLCEVRVRDNAFEDARASCQKALSGGVDDASVHANLGLALFRMGDKDGAKKEIGIAASKGAKDKSTLLVQGLLAEADGREVEAMGFYDKVLAQDANNVEANAQEGKLLLKRAKYAEAAKKLQKAWKADPQNAAVSVPLAKAQLGAGKLTDAQRTIKSIPQGAVDEPTRLGLDGQVQSALGNFRKANDLYEKALKARPGDAELLALQGQNYLKLPHYEKAISLLEQAQKADPSRTDVSEQLARLYAETGNTQKAAAQLNRLDAIEKAEVEQQRKTIDPKDIKRVSIAKPFDNIAKTDDPVLAKLDRGLRDLVAMDIARSPYIEVIDHTEEGQKAVAEARDRAVADKDAVKADARGENAAGYALSGTFQAGGDSLTITCTITDVHTKRSWGGSETGPKDRYAEIEKRAVLQMLSNFVPLSDRERSALERTAGTANLESFVKMNEAEAAKKRGDLRGALQLYKEAQAADAGNAKAAVGLDEAKQKVTDMNRVAIVEPKVIGEVDQALVLGLRHTLSTKLAGVHGIQVIDSQRVDEVIGAERDYLKENKENFDPATLPQDGAKQIAANILLQPHIETAGEGVTVGAALVEFKDGKLLLGDEVNGPKGKLLDLQNELAINIVKKLYGEPTEAEMEILRKKQSMDEYKSQMAELTRLREAEKARKAQDATVVAELKPEEKKPELKKPEPPKPLAMPLPPPKPPTPTVTVKAEPGPQPMFQVGIRSALNAKDLANESHLGGGLMMTWAAMWSRHARVAFLMDLESTSWTGRNEAGKGHTSYYGFGLDIGIPVAWKGNGLLFGAEVSYGLMQSICAASSTCIGDNSTKPVNGGVLMLMPHAGLKFSIKGVGLYADAGWRFEFLKKDALRDASLGGLVLQGGLQLDMEESYKSRKKGGEIAYQARFFAPNDKGLYSKYGSTLIGHELSFAWTKNSSPSIDNGFALGYMGGSSDTSSDKSLRIVEMSWLFKWHAFSAAQFVNPYLGWRLGFQFIQSQFAVDLGDATSKGQTTGFVAAGIGGVDVYLGRSFALRGGFSYDYVASGDISGSTNASYSGYAVETGAVFRY